MSDDNLAPILPRLVQLLLVVLDRAAADGERINAAQALDRCLQGAGTDKHELVERIKHPPVSQEDMQKVYDAGYAKCAADAQELRQRVVAVTQRSGREENGVNGYSWREVLGFCLLNKARIRNQWEANFIESVAGQLLTSYGCSDPSERQAPILRRIFISWFDGKIV